MSEDEKHLLQMYNLETTIELLRQQLASAREALSAVMAISSTPQANGCFLVGPEFATARMLVLAAIGGGDE